jgi:uncharacterized protein DUF6353
MRGHIVTAIPSLYARRFDDNNLNFDPRSYENNAAFLHAQQSYANARLQAQGYLFLNDVYDMLGFNRTGSGQLVGWLKGTGDNYVDFNIVKVEDENAFLLDFNIDGVIYHKIDNL